MFCIKYKQWIQLAFSSKLLADTFILQQYRPLAIALTLYLLLMLQHLKFKPCAVKLLLTLALLEGTMYEPMFSVVIAYSFSRKQNIYILFTLYTVRMSAYYWSSFKVSDWVFLGLQFLIMMVHFRIKKPIPYVSIKTESHDEYSIFNFMPFGICFLDQYYQVTSHNSKAMKYISKIMGNGEFQNQLLLLIQKYTYFYISACIQNQEIQNMNLGSVDSLVHENFQLQRIQSVSYRKRSETTKPPGIKLIPDLDTIFQRYKHKLNQRTSLNKLKYKCNNKTTFEIRICELPNGYMVILQNISQEENCLVFSERYKFQQMFLNSFSHELRTPINCSLQLLQALDGQIKQKLTDMYLKPSIISIRKLLYQINDILDYGYFEAGKFKLKTTSFQLSSIINLIKEYYQQECDHKQIQLEIQSLIDCQLTSDFDRIMQIIVNLLNNSIKFTRTGRIKLIITRIGSLYQFQIMDSGCGINAQKLYLIQKILENSHQDFFNRGDEELIQYVGLGLKVSSQIARNLSNKGRLVISSNENQYTCTKFLVQDMRKGDEAMNIPNEIEIQLPYNSIIKQKCQCAKILICDDIPSNHIALGCSLKRVKLEHESAYDGQMAVDMVLAKRCCRYKLIFMDIDMPIKDGFEASVEVIVQINKIMKFDPEINIIMCSAYDNPELVEASTRCGMKALLSKPIDRKQLMRVLNKYYF